MTVTEKTSAALQWLDYVIIGIVLLISVMIGIYYRFTGGRQKTTKEYFSANRSMNVLMLSINLMVTSVSAITLLGCSGENYIHGSAYIVMLLGLTLAVPIVAYFYLPVYFGLQNMSVYEYLNRRFGATARLVASLTMYVRNCLLGGIDLYAPSLAIEATTGLSNTASILLIGLICTFYSSVGGMKAVLATDVFQGVLMLASLLCAIGIGCYDIEGGISEVWDVAKKGGRLDIFKETEFFFSALDNLRLSAVSAALTSHYYALCFDVDPTIRHTWWSLIFGGLGICLGGFGVNQVNVQRLLSARSLNSARLALLLSIPLIMLLVLATSFSGLVLYAWFEGCDPVTSGQISSFDQVLPYFARIRLSLIPGLLGFFVAGIFSAALSTASAILNSLAAIAVADYIVPLYRKFGREIPDSKAVFLGKILVVVNGLLAMGFAFAMSSLGHVLETFLAINGMITGPILGLFSLGLFVETANEKGAVIGTLVSLCISAWTSFGRPKPPVPQLPVSIDECSNSSYTAIAAYQELHASRNSNESDYFYLYRISYMWYTPLGMATTILFGYVASTVVRCFSKDSIVEPDPDLFTPILSARMKRRRDDAAQTTSSQVFVLSTE